MRENGSWGRGNFKITPSPTEFQVTNLSPDISPQCHLPGQLSGGQQRVSIARAIYNRPAILLADEPTGNLDRSTGAEIVSLLKEANRTWKQTLLLITHDENIALQADRMLCIEDGEITRDERIRSLGGDE